MKTLGEMSRQEIRNKARNRWLLIALILLGCAILQSTLATALCDSFEPLGSCPETNLAIRPAVNYTNNMRVHSSGLTMYSLFEYNASDNNENISYKVINRGNGTCYTPLSDNSNGNYCFDIKHDVRDPVTNIITTTTIYRPTKLDFSFEFWTQSQWSRKWSFEATSLTREMFIPVNASNYTYTIFNTSYSTNSSNLDWSAQNWTFSIKGKSLIVNVTEIRHENITSPNGGRVYYWTFDTTATNNGQNIFIVTMDNNTIDTDSQQDFLLIGNQTFFRAGNVYDKSDSSTYDGTAYTRVNKTEVTPNVHTTYNNMTNGSKNLFKETFVFTVSKNPYDMNLYIPNPQSSFYNSLLNSWTYEFWSCVNCTGGIWNTTVKYQNYGFDMSKAILLRYSLGVPNPSRINYSTNSPTNTYDYIRNESTNIRNLGVSIAAYNSLQDMDTTDPFYDNSNANGTFFNATNYSYISRDSSSSLQSAFGSSKHTAYCSRYGLIDYVAWNSTQTWLTNGLLLDTEGATELTTNYIDYRWNGTFGNTAQRGIRRLGTECMYNYSTAIKAKYNIFISTENHFGLFTAGIQDHAEGGTDCCGDNSQKGLIPSNYILGITEKMIITDDYLRRCMLGWADDNKAKYGALGTDETQYQRCQVRAVAYRNTLHLDGNIYDLHRIPDNLTIATYYMRKKLGELMYAGQLKNETYYNTSNGAWMDLTTALVQGYDWKNASFHQEYTNGLHLYINLRSESNHWLNITANGATRKIPQNGFYAYTEDGTFEEFYNDLNQSHWVRTSSFIYIYPKSGSVTLSNLTAHRYTPKIPYSTSADNGFNVYGRTDLVTTYTTSSVVLLVIGDDANLIYCASTVSETLRYFQSIGLALLIIAISALIYFNKREMIDTYKTLVAGGIITIITVIVLVLGTAVCQ